jgi:hypothetical protein
LIAKAAFYRTLSSRMAVEIARVKAEMEAMELQEKPVIKDHPIDGNLQTGESRLLGGGLSIHAPYRKTDTMADPWQ